MSAAEAPIERLLPDPGPTTIAAEVGRYDPLAAAERRDAAKRGDGSGDAGAIRPFVAMNFAATLDGRAAIDGRSGPIGTAVDTALLLHLRSRFDAVLIGAGTLRAERYGRLLKDPALRAGREKRGLRADPVAVILSRTLDLPWDTPLFTCGEGEILILTAHDAADGAAGGAAGAADDGPPGGRATTAPPPEIPECATPTELVTFPGESVAFGDALSHLRGERGIRTLLCEGGPTVHGRLQAAGLVDELFLTLGPRLSGGPEPRILEGALPEIRRARLVSLLRSDSELMTHYAIDPSMPGTHLHPEAA